MALTQVQSGMLEGGLNLSPSAPANTLVTTSAGNVGIGTSSPTFKIQSEGTTPAYFGFNSTAGTQVGYASALPTNTLNCYVGWIPETVGTGGVNGDLGLVPRTSAGASIRFFTGSTSASERMRVTGAGDFLIGNTAFTWPPTQNGYQFKAPATPWFVITGNDATADNSFGPTVRNLNASFNGTRFFVRVDGGVANYSANNQNLSDERVKNNIELSGNYLDKICAIPVKLFNYKDEPEGTQKSLGVIAQDVEAVAPELINSTDGFGEEDVGDEPLKMVYQTDLQYALMKCIQEQQAIIKDLKARIETLEAK